MKKDPLTEDAENAQITSTTVSKVSLVIAVIGLIITGWFSCITYHLGVLTYNLGVETDSNKEQITILRSIASVDTTMMQNAQAQLGTLHTKATIKLILK